MKVNHILYFATITFLLFFSNNLFAQTSDSDVRTIYFMRAKQFYGSGAKMDLMINGKLVYQLRSGNRLIVKLKKNDTVSVQVIYTPLKSNKSNMLKILPEGNDDVYVDLFYWGEGYNPLKHSGPIKGPIGESPKFNIEVVRMLQPEGKLKFEQSESYKDNGKIPEKSL